MRPCGSGWDKDFAEDFTIRAGRQERPDRGERGAAGFPAALGSPIGSAPEGREGAAMASRLDKTSYDALLREANAMSVDLDLTQE